MTTSRKKRKRNPFQESLKRLKPIDFTLCSLFDAFFYIFVVAFGYVLYVFLETKLNMPAYDLTTDYANIAKSAAFEQAMFSFITVATVTAVLYLAMIVVLFAVFKGLIWSRLMNRKFTLQHLNHFIKLSIIWLVSWVLTFMVIIFITIDPAKPFVFIILTFLAFHTSQVVYILFTKENLLGHALKKGLSVAIGDFGRFVTPYLIIIAGMVILVGGVFKIFHLILRIELLYNLVVSLVLIVYLVWVRTYIMEVVDSIMHYK